MVIDHRLELRAVRPRGRDHLAAVFAAPAGFAFQAGQWGNLMVEVAPGQIEPRALSFASAPHELPEVELCVRRKTGSPLVAALERATPGAAFELAGPFGAFVRNGPLAPAVVFAATSTGLAPLRGLLRAAFHDGAVPGTAYLFQGNPGDEEAPYQDEWSEWQAHWPALEAHSQRSDPARDENDPAAWDDLRTRVLAAVRTRSHYDWQVFLAGHGAFLTPLRATLRETLGLQRTQIKAETFWA